MSDLPKNTDSKKVVDVHSTASDKKGLAGFFEMLLRRFRIVSYVAALMPLYVIIIIIMGISATPGVLLYKFVMAQISGYPDIWHALITGCMIMAGYFLYGFTLLLVIPAFNYIFTIKMKPFRGGYYSLESVPWSFHNAFTYVARYTFLEFVTPTPINTLFYRMMGMKIGKGSHLNTTNISDPAFIEIGDNVTIGGSVHLLAHYASKGFLIVDKVRIGDGVTIGLKATVMGSVEIGKGAVIGPHEVILPKSKVPPGRKPFEPFGEAQDGSSDQPSQDFL